MLAVRRENLEAEVLAVIERRVGPDASIKAGELAQMFGYRDDRVIRLAIRELRKKSPILSYGAGYFWPEN